MSTKFTDLTEELYSYTLDNWLREEPVLRELRDETANLEMARMQIAPDQGQFMALMVTLLGAKKILEIGTFTGYSALAMAKSLPDDGKITCLDVSEEWTNIAKKYWLKAGVDTKIDLKIGPAVESLNEMLSSHKASFDLAFIDADKENYNNYYELCLSLLKPGGAIMLDNVFWGGSVCDQSDQDIDTIAIRDINQKIKNDGRVDIAIVPIGDGLTIARKK